MGVIPGALLTERIAVLSPSRTKTGSGGWTEAHAQVALLPGRVVAAGEGPREERLRGGQAAGVELARIYLDTTGFALEGRQRLQAGGATYEILEIDRQGELAVCLARRV